MVRKIATACDDRGTRCSVRIFMRSPGMTHSAASRSISAHRAPRVSPGLVAVRIMKRSPCKVWGSPSYAASFARKSGKLFVRHRRPVLHGAGLEYF
jgi:hypothetical protein